MRSPAAGNDWARLGAGVRASLVPAIGLAFLSFAAIVALTAAVSRFEAGVWLIVAAFFYCHAVFIAAVAWKQVRPAQPASRCVRSPGLAAGALLVLPIFMFVLLDGQGAAYSCADGVAYRSSFVPNLPWAWIGWAALSLTAFPVRCIAAVIKKTPPLVPVWRRLLPMLAFLPGVLLLGFPFERHVPSCVPPFDGWGMFEGGAVLWPLLGLFLFVMSFSMAALSAAYVDQDRLG